MGDLEDEMICPICFEIYIEPSVVGCGHMFCKFCIDQWSDRMNKCPICRLDIEGVVRITNGNAIMELVTKLLSEEARNRRAGAIEQRIVDRRNFEESRRRRSQPIQAQSLGNWNQLIRVVPREGQFQGHYQRGANYYQHNTPRWSYNRRRYPSAFAGRAPHNDYQRHRWRPL